MAALQNDAGPPLLGRPTAGVGAGERPEAEEEAAGARVAGVEPELRAPWPTSTPAWATTLNSTLNLAVARRQRPRAQTTTTSQALALAQAWARTTR